MLTGTRATPADTTWSCLVDETGLFPERSRDLLAGLRSSVSARNGKVRHISIRGDSPLFKEILENPVVVSSVHAAADGCSIDDEAAWRAANPGLGTIKSLDYMRSQRSHAWRVSRPMSQVSGPLT